MENHPIPQDVTGFKFKLIGSVTIKQFLYILGGGIPAGIILFLLPQSINFFLRIPFAALFASVGLGLAFVPIDGRPMDKMLINFAKTVPSENKYLYRKKGVSIAAFDFRGPHQVGPQKTSAAPAPASQSKKDIIRERYRKSHYKTDEGEAAFVNTIKSFFEETKTIEPKESIAKKMQAQDLKIEQAKPIELPHNVSDQVAAIRAKLQEAQIQQKTHGNSAELEISIKELQQKLQEALSANESLQHKVTQLSQQKKEVVYKPTQAPQASSHVTVITEDNRLASGFPSLPDIPNIVLGIIKDPRGKVLPNIVVEVVDMNNTPVRAFKTNVLGQFAAATPLSNGHYKVVFDDTQKKNDFDTVEITLDGTIFQPLEIISMDQREKLRLELFGAQAA